jgi:uncharacterized protein (AIM24 family)
VEPLTAAVKLTGATGIACRATTRTLAPGEVLTLDTGHVVAFDDTVQYSVRKAGSWKSTLLGGEGLVTDFTGPGRVWLQTRSSMDLISWIQSKLPPQRS